MDTNENLKPKDGATYDHEEFLSQKGEKTKIAEEQKTQDSTKDPEPSENESKLPGEKRSLDFL